jgi:uncharacterized RDD family membrane protein YckC
MAISIETTQNVQIDYEIASIGDRVLGSIVDGFILLAYIIALLLLIGAIDVELGPAWMVMFYLPMFLYDLLCEIFMEGQSFGKKAMRTKVVKVDGSEPGVGSYLLRWLLRPVDSFFMLGLLVIAAGGKGQRLGDLAAGTTVIKRKPRLTLDETLMPEVDEAYVPTYPEVARLSDRDVAIIRDVFSASRRQQTRATVNALAVRVATILGIETPADVDAFLETVVRDYTSLTRGEQRL